MSVTLVTGANKGIGFATARRLAELGHTVYVGARDTERGEAAVARLGPGARHVLLDVTDDASVAEAMRQIGTAEGRLDVLVNNAGIADGSAPLDQITGADALRAFDTNAVGVIRTIQAALPLLRRSDAPAIVNVSSALGSFWAVTNPDRPQSDHVYVVYAATKAAVSMLTVQYAKALPGIRVNAVEPGFTATDLNGHTGHQTPEEAAEVVVTMATLGADGPTGTFVEPGGALRW